MDGAASNRVDWFATSAADYLRRLGEAAALTDELGLPAAARRDAYAVLFGGEDAVPGSDSISLPPLVGREHELAELTRLLRGDEAQPVTLTGPSGSGKTRLARAVMAELDEDFADGALFVPLAPLGDPTLVLPTVARALGVWERPNRPLDDHLRAFLATRQILLVLDAAERVRTGVAAVATLLTACPGARLLVTSREPVELANGIAYPLTPLPLPAPAGSAGEAEDLAASAAVRLLVELLPVPRDRLSAADLRAAAALCRRLEGMPLAIELAAARAGAPRSGRLEELLVARRSARMSEETRRNRAVEATIAWSYGLLSPADQRLFRCLAVFAGGGQAEAVAAVGRRAGLAFDAQASLGALRAANLVEVVARGGDELRYAMLDPIREYGLEQLARNDEAGRVNGAFAGYCLALAEAAESRLYGPEQLAALDHLADEYPNLRTAMAWAEQQADWETVARFAGALGRFWIRRGYPNEGRRWLDLVGRIGRIGRKISPPVRAKVFLVRGLLAYSQGEYREAVDSYRRGLRLFRRIGDQVGIADALTNLGAVYYRLGNLRQANAHYRASLRIARALGDDRLAGNALLVLGNSAADQGRVSLAFERYTEALALRRRLGDRKGIADALNNLGILMHDRGEYIQAEAYYAESLDLRRTLDDRLNVAVSLTNLGALAHDLGQPDLAAERYRGSLRLYDAVGDLRGVADALSNLANVALGQGDRERAAARWAESLEVYERIGDERGIAKSRRSLGMIAAHDGDLGRAIRLHQPSLAAFHRLGQQLEVAEGLEFMAAPIGMADPALAVRLLAAAAALREAIEAPLAPKDRERIEAELAAMRERLGDAAFDAHWTAGRQSSPEAIVAEAMAEDLAEVVARAAISKAPLVASDAQRAPR